MFTNTAYSDSGGMLVYAPDLVAMSEKAAGYVTKILRGAKPSDLPVEQPTKFEYIVNQKAAREQGVVLLPTTMYRATRVIE
jgi:putative ABC transport system substrate-binding protein